MQVRGGVVDLKGCIYCFGDIILLLKYVQGEKGVQKFRLFKFTYFMDRPLEQKVNKQRLSYSQMIRSTNKMVTVGKQFSTCKYKTTN